MRRREFITVLWCAMVARPSASRAQQKAMPVIGWLGAISPGFSAPQLAAFRQGLSEAGYVEGQNVAIEYRWAEGQDDRLPALAADLVARKVDVIQAAGGSRGILAAKGATSTIPIVFVGGDPRLLGYASNLAQSGGNLTGVSIMGTELMPKRLELLSELVPQAGVIALLVDPNNPSTGAMVRDVEEGARAKGVQLQVVKAGTASEIDAAFASLAQLHAGALLAGGQPFLHSRRVQIVALAARYAVPAMYEWRESVEAGGLLSYGPSLNGLWRQAGVYVGRILAGAKPADLPIQQPTRFELVVNLKTAEALGLTIPQSILGRADEVIE